MFVRGTGIGFGFMPAMTAAFASLDRSELSDATPQLNVLQRIGGSLGTALLAVVLQRSLAGQHTLAGMAGAYGTAFWASAALAAAGFVPALMLMRAERAARRAKGAEKPAGRGAGGGGGMTEPEPYEKFGLAFRSVSAAIARLKGRETHRPGELSYAQLGLLFRLAEAGPLPAGELAGLADLSPATTTQLLDGLARAGIVERTRSETDKRVVSSALTERGRELVEERRAVMEARWRAALEEFSDEQLLVGAAMLERIRELFDELAEQPVVPAAKLAS